MGLLWGLPAAAERSHTVRQGQNMARIAKRYRVSVGDLAAANGLKRTATLRLGQELVIPARGIVYVRPGQTLAAIAKRHDISVRELARKNRIKPDRPLRVGQRLVLPGFEAAEALDKAEKRWGRPRRPGTATFYRVWSKEKRRVRLVDNRGRVRKPALTQLRHLMRPKNSRKRKSPHRRLLRLLAQVSDHFGGRTINIVSGYRRPGGYTKASSRHVHAQALDFRIRGVPLGILRDYCRRFNHVGVGYYPRSHFVHLDVRRTDARWTDWSLPGHAPMRHPPGQRPTLQADVNSAEPEAEDDGQPPIDDAPDPLVDK